MSVRLIAKSVWNNPGNYGKRTKKTLDAIAWQVQKRIARSPRVFKLPNGLLFRAHPDCVISSALIYADWPEFHELTFLRKWLKAGDIIIDVGAYIGHISLLLADVVGPDHIFAFEPTPVTFRRLVANWELNGWTTDQLFQSAVGRKTGTVFIPDASNPVPTNAITRSREDSVEVPLVCLDSFLPVWQGDQIGLLKMDVEGYEREVFYGSSRLLKEARPRFIMFESLSGAVDATIASLLADCEYIVFQLDCQGRPDFTHDSAQNLFATRIENRHRIESE
jgi:FkbM family methyltransferase